MKLRRKENPSFFLFFVVSFISSSLPHFRFVAFFDHLLSFFYSFSPFFLSPPSFLPLSILPLHRFCLHFPISPPLKSVCKIKKAHKFSNNHSKLTGKIMDIMTPSRLKRNFFLVCFSSSSLVTMFS